MREMRTIVLLILVVMMTSIRLEAQQLPVILNFSEAPSIINPAFAGYNGFSEVDILYKKLWMGIPGSSESQIFNVHTFIKPHRIGLGFKVTNDINNFLGYTGATANLSYLIPVSENSGVRVGLAPSFSFHRIYFDRLKADDPYEEIILERAENASIFDVDFGVGYYTEKFSIGLAVLQMVNGSANFKTEETGKILRYSHLRHFHLMSTYKLKLPTPYWNLQPEFFAYSPQGLKSLMGVALKAIYKDQFSIAPTYTHEVSIGAKVGVVLDKQFKLNYAVDLPTTAIKNVAKPSHEITIGYRFGKHFKESREQQILEELKLMEKETTRRFDQMDELIQKDTAEINRKIREQITLLNATEPSRLDQLDQKLSSPVTQDSLQLQELIRKELENYRLENTEAQEKIEELSKAVDTIPTSQSYIHEIEEFKQENLRQRALIEQMIKKSDSINADIMLYKSLVMDLEGVIRDVQLALVDSINPAVLQTEFYQILGAFKTHKYARIFQRGIKRQFDINGTIKNAYQGNKEYFVVYAAITEKLKVHAEQLDIYKRRILLYEYHGFVEEHDRE